MARPRSNADAYPRGASADGRTIFYSAIDQLGNEDIFSVTLQNGTRTRKPLLTTRAEESGPVPSPAGKWLAYMTNVPGRGETRVGDLDDLSSSVQVSVEGGVPVRWSADGRRLYYRDGGTIAVVDVGPSGPVLASRARAFHLPPDVRGSLDVMPDGQTAVMVRGGLMYSDLVIVQGALKVAPR